MSGRGRRKRNGAWAAAGVALVIAVGCSGRPETTGASGTPAPDVQTPSPSALSTEEVFLEDRERPRVEAAWERFAEAYETGDWATVASLTTYEGLAYFVRLQRAAAAAGPGAIRRMDTFQRTAVAVLRGAGDHGRLASAPVGEFLDLLDGYRLLGGPGDFRDLPIGEIQVLGDKALTRIAQSPTSAWEIDFELEGGEWKVDLGDVAYVVGDLLEGAAERQGADLDRMILAVASKVTGERVTEAVWQKP